MNTDDTGYAHQVKIPPGHLNTRQVKRNESIPEDYSRVSRFRRLSPDFGKNLERKNLEKGWLMKARGHEGHSSGARVVVRSHMTLTARERLGTKSPRAFHGESSPCPPAARAFADSRVWWENPVLRGRGREIARDTGLRAESADPGNRSDATPNNRGRPVFPSVPDGTYWDGAARWSPGIRRARAPWSPGGCWWDPWTSREMRAAVHRNTSHARALSVTASTNSRRYRLAAASEGEGERARETDRREGGRGRGRKRKDTEITRGRRGGGFPGSRGSKWIARDDARDAPREREGIAAAVEGDERRMEDEARAITWLGLGESLDAPF